MDVALQAHQYSAEDPLPADALEPSGIRNHVVDVLDVHDVEPEIVQVLDQRPVASRPEPERPVDIAERLTVRSHGDGVGAREAASSSM